MAFGFWVVGWEQKRMGLRIVLFQEKRTQQKTKQSRKAKPYECEMLKVDSSDPPTIYHANDNSDFSGRTGIYELLFLL